MDKATQGYKALPSKRGSEKASSQAASGSFPVSSGSVGSSVSSNDSFVETCIFPQIAIAIGVLTSKKGEGRRTTLADWTWHQAGAIVGCHCSVLWLGGRVTTNFRGADVVPLLGAIVGCHCSVLWLGGRVTTNWSGRGAIAGCHCSVPL